jgi:hypothetical protein
MTSLILMLAVAAAMVLFREPLGRGLVRLVEAVDKRRLVMLVVLLFLVWALLHQIQIVAGPITSDGLVALFDTSTYAALFDATTYADLMIGVAAAVLDQRTRRLLVRMAGSVRRAVHRVMGRATRARRAPSRPSRRLPDRDEPEPALDNGVLAFA